MISHEYKNKKTNPLSQETPEAPASLCPSHALHDSGSLCLRLLYTEPFCGADSGLVSGIISLLGGSAEEEISRYASANGYDISDYPQSLIDLYDRNKETKDFVFEYPAKKDETPAIDLSTLNTSSVPLLMQWDQRWGYKQYAGDLFGLSGCGPTCLSMVAI